MGEPTDLHRTKALELAIQSGGTRAEVVIRANAYHEFLTGKPITVSATPAPTSTPKPAAATASKSAARAKPRTPRTVKRKGLLGRLLG